MLLFLLELYRNIEKLKAFMIGNVKSVPKRRNSMTQAEIGKNICQNSAQLDQIDLKIPKNLIWKHIRPAL